MIVEDVPSMVKSMYSTTDSHLFMHQAVTHARLSMRTHTINNHLINGMREWMNTFCFCLFDVCLLGHSLPWLWLVISYDFDFILCISLMYFMLYSTMVCFFHINISTPYTVFFQLFRSWPKSKWRYNCYSTMITLLRGTVSTQKHVEELHTKIAIGLLLYGHTESPKQTFQSRTDGIW